MPAPSAAGIALGVQRADYDSALEAYGCFQPTSLDQPGPDGRRIGDFVADDASEQPAAEARLILTPIVRTLPERDRRILYLRFYQDQSQQQIADELGITQMQVSRLLTSVFARLRDAIENGADIADGKSSTPSTAHATSLQQRAS